MANRFGALVLFLFLSSLDLAIAAAPHPLETLSASEIKTAVEVVKTSGKFTENIRFPILSLQEPKKADVLRFEEKGVAPARQAFVLVFEMKLNKVYETIVDLAAKKIVNKKEIKNQQPPILLEEYERLFQIVKADSKWQAAIKKRGLNPDDIWVDGWAPGLLSPKERAAGKRLMRGISYLKGTRANFYSRPVEGLIVTVDMNAGKVSDIWDVESPKPADGVRELDEASTPDLDKKLKPLIAKQPDGVSFKVDGPRVTWDDWTFLFTMHPQKGLVIHDIRFRGRKILYKGMLSEMVVPYGDPEKTWSFRNAFDVGEYGLGRTAQVLEKGKDVPDNAGLYDAVFADDVGGILEIPQAVGIFEKDGGLLWKHMDQYTRKAASRRARDLVVTFTTTIGNYDYGISWIFHQDGVIDVEAHLTGIMLARGSSLEKNPCVHECKHLVESRIIAPNHQHFFAFRLDFDVDGTKNVPVESNTKAIPPGKDNPSGNAFDAFPTYITSEKAGPRDLNLATARKWKIMNREVTNGIGHPTAYLLYPGESGVPYLQPDSIIRKRARFLNHHAWFTRYHDDEQSAAGEYPNQNFSGEGVEKWMSNGESLDGQDVVMWYVFGITHVARPEEWPVMNAHRAGFKLIPVNFFSSNPAAALKAE